MPTQALPFDWNDFFQRLAGTYIAARTPEWIDRLTGRTRPALQQNTEQMRKAIEDAFTEEERRIQEMLYRRGVQGSPQIVASAMAPLSTRRALALAQVQQIEDQARYADDLARWQQHRMLVQSIMPYLFGYQYPGEGGVTYQRPGVITHLFDLVFNRPRAVATPAAAVTQTAAPMPLAGYYRGPVHLPR